MKKSSSTALLPFEAEDAAAILAGKIRTARIARGWTQAELAVRCGLSTRTVTSIEAGSVSVQFGFWLKALWALDLIHDFISGSRSVGRNDHELALLASNMPLRARDKGRPAP